MLLRELGAGAWSTTVHSALMWVGESRAALSVGTEGG